MNSPKDKTGILLLAFGAPSDTTEIEPFLRSITGLDRLPESYLSPVIEKYRAIGGSSPFNKITAEVALKLQNLLGDNYEVHYGFRHASPRINEAIKKLRESGIKTILSLCLTPHYSYFSSGDYISRVEEIIGSQRNIKSIYIKSWHNHPSYIELLSERIKSSVKNFPPENVCVLFTAHSLPLDKMPEDDPYVNQLQETLQLVRSKFQNNLQFRLAFQSRRPGKDRWLEPEALSEIERLSAEGFKRILVVPLSFVCDHLETLYDIDIVMKEKANKLGVNLTRVPSFNSDNDFVNVLKNILMDYLKRI
jgi:ferrochelatase